MKRLLVVVVVFAVTAGCRGTGTTAPLDPFFGPTRIEPPRTGWNTGRPAPDPYYSTPRQAATPRQATPAAAGVRFEPNRSTTTSTWTASSPDAYRQVSHTKSAPPGDSTIDRTAPPQAHIQIPLAARREVPRSAVAEPDESPRPELSFVPETVTTSPPRSSNRVIDIMDLPPASTSDAWHGPGLVRSATYVSDAEDSAARSPRRAAPPAGARDDWTGQAVSSSAKFGHDADYSRLRGQLEYSQIDCCWRLRYLPVDGQTDRFGGSVLLKETPRLAGFERGDFVEITGRVSSAGNGKKTFAPDFEVADVRALSS